MDTAPFTITYTEGDKIRTAEIRPCCKDHSVVDYAVWSNGKLAFTVTKDAANNHWVVALKNADESIDESIIQEIGRAIEKKYANR